MKTLVPIVALFVAFVAAADVGAQGVDPLFKYRPDNADALGKNGSIPVLYQKTATSLLYVLADVERAGSWEAEAVRRAVEGRGADHLMADDAGRIKVYIQLSKGQGSVPADVIRLGVETEYFHQASGLIQGWLPLERLEELVRIDEIVSVDPVVSPVLHTGSVTTEGDAVLYADLVRPEGVDGAGVCVGAISDGVASLSTAQSTGDVPGSVEISPEGAGTGNEGVALLEIIHDLAPGATLAFAKGTGGKLTMESAIHWLAYTACGGGADVIIDDVGYYDMPWFQDGLLANKVEEVVAAGVTYVTAAGNAGEDHYEEAYVQGSSVTVKNGTSNVTLSDPHDFGTASGGSSQVKLPVQLADNADILLWMQWNDPFGAASVDLDAFIVADDASNTVVSSSARFSGQETNPLEWAYVQNRSGSTKQYNIIVNWVNRPASPASVPQVKLFCLIGCVINSYSASPGSIVGHQAAVNAITVGAVNHDTPDTIAPYSSQGPVDIYFSPVSSKSMAAPIETRDKPELVAADNVAITGAGGFPNPFKGTSAAAPHVAAIAALLLEIDPTLTPAQMKSRLEDTAVDLGTAGFDQVYGSGRIDAVAAAFESGLRLYGDISDNGVLSSLDASEALQHAIGTISLSGSTGRAADVSSNGAISSFDASLILQRVLELITCFPVESFCGGASKTGTAGSASFAWMEPAQDAAHGGRYIPIVAGRVTGAITAVELSARIEGSAARIDGLRLSVPSDWTAEHRVVDNELRVAMAGITPLADGEVGRIAVSGEMGPLTVTGSVSVNESAPAPLLPSAEAPLLAQDVELLPNYPNPFSGTTQLRYRLPERTYVSIEIYDMIGRRVATLVDGTEEPGLHTVAWDAGSQSLPAGVYWYRLRAGDSTISRSTSLLR